MNDMQLVHVNKQEINNLDGLIPGKKIHGTGIKDYSGLKMPFKTINEATSMNQPDIHHMALMQAAKASDSSPVHIDKQALASLKNLHRTINGKENGNDLSQLGGFFKSPHVKSMMNSSLAQNKAAGGQIQDYFSKMKQGGRNGDTELALVPNELMRYLHHGYGIGTSKNPHTGHHELFLGGMFDNLGSIFKPVKNFFGGLFNKGGNYNANGGAEVPAENPFKNPTPGAPMPGNSAGGAETNPFKPQGGNGASGQNIQYQDNPWKDNYQAPSSPPASGGAPSWMSNVANGIISQGAGMIGGAAGGAAGNSAGTAIGNMTGIPGAGRVGGWVGEHAGRAGGSRLAQGAVSGAGNGMADSAYNMLPSMPTRNEFSNLAGDAYNMLPGNPFSGMFGGGATGQQQPQQSQRPNYPSDISSYTGVDDRDYAGRGNPFLANHSSNLYPSNDSDFEDARGDPEVTANSTPWSMHNPMLQYLG